MNELIKSFRLWNKEHKNFMTPRILKVKNIRNYFIELSEGFDFDNRDILSLNAEKFKLKQYLKKLDLEYKQGTLDTRGYLRTRENLLKELWKLRH